MTPRFDNTPTYLEEDRFLDSHEAVSLMKTAEGLWICRNKTLTPKRDAFVIQLGLATGLRVCEMAGLSCGDLRVTPPWSSVLVRHGKGDKRRTVPISPLFRERCVSFIEAKGKSGEPTRPDSPVFYSTMTGTALTRRALQKSFKRTAHVAGLAKVYSIHALRHTFGTEMCRSSTAGEIATLRMVQRLMGHSSLQTTLIYLHTARREVERTVERHWLRLKGELSEEEETRSALWPAILPMADRGNRAGGFAY